MQDCFDDIAKFKAVLANHGVPRALAFLNRRAPHRYTAIYKLDGDVMLNMGIHDRLGQVVSPLSPTPRDHSFCSYVQAGQAFVSEDVLTDPRLATHFQRGLVNPMSACRCRAVPDITTARCARWIPKPNICPMANTAFWK